jgi:hypothetical protein
MLITFFFIDFLTIVIDFAPYFSLFMYGFSKSSVLYNVT